MKKFVFLRLLRALASRLEASYARASALTPLGPVFVVRRDAEDCRGGEEDKMESESVESSNCDSLRIEASSSDDIFLFTGLNIYIGMRVY